MSSKCCGDALFISYERALRDEVLGLGVRADNCVGRLLGVELEAFGDFDANTVSAQDLGDLGVVV